ncbi:MAG: tail fiber protein [Methylobacter sp.]|nr:tail fiber protein [Methylobacter sp.]
MSQYYVGEIRLFAGNYAPEGDWMKCEGQLLNVSQYQALFALLGTTYGGNGSTTFALPDYRGRIPVGQGTGTNLTARTLGQTGGNETVTLNASQWAAHNHSFNTLNADATANALPASSNNMAHAKGMNGVRIYLNDSAPSPTVSTLDAVSYGSAGGGQSHNNMMPSLAMTYIIATNGLFPTRS